jgi:hypothetical protein
MTIVGNIFADCDQGVHIAGGRWNNVTNNVFVRMATAAVRADARGVSGGPFNPEALMASLTSVPYRVPPWSTRYPWLVNITLDEPHQPLYNSIKSNIVVLAPSVVRNRDEVSSSFFDVRAHRLLSCCIEYH